VFPSCPTDAVLGRDAGKCQGTSHDIMLYSLFRVEQTQNHPALAMEGKVLERIDFRQVGS